MFEEVYAIEDNDEKRFVIVQNTQSGEIAVLKTVRSEIIKFLKNISANAAHLPKIYEFGNDYIIEESIAAGNSLADKLLTEALSLKEICSIIEAVCAALLSLHNIGLCHMDIAPGNILCCEKGAYLTDYSASLPFETIVERTGHASIEMASPEHFGFDSVDAATDVYSVAALLKYLLDINCCDEQIEPFCKLINQGTTVSKKDRIQNICDFQEKFRNVCLRHTDMEQSFDKIKYANFKKEEKFVITRDIFNSLDNVSDLAEFFTLNENNFIEINTPKFFENIFQSKNLKKSEVVKKSEIERTYAYQLLNGTKKPSRDKLIQLCIGASLTFEETQLALKYNGFKELYPKIKRDCIIIYALKAKKSVMEAEELLYRFNQETLNNI